MLRILIVVVIVLVAWAIGAILAILACMLVRYCRISDGKGEPLLKDLKDEKKDNTL